MARRIKNTRNLTSAETLDEWFEGTGLLFEYKTPQQVREYLMRERGMDAAEAFAYVEGLRGTDAGHLMTWERDG